jgi:hypothetical protein
MFRLRDDILGVDVVRRSLPGDRVSILPVDRNDSVSDYPTEFGPFSFRLYPPE